jgi:cyclopropane fatty-acyl-phospholipid synthase-like methyltransferase
VIEFSPHDVEWTPEKVNRVWSYYASALPADQFFSSHSGAHIVDRLETEIGLRGRRVLDFGCGRGDLMLELFARGIAATGLEFSEEVASEARRRFAAEPLFRGVEVSATLPTSIADEFFDVVLLIEVVEHLLEPEIAATLGEVRRILSPGGLVVVTAPNSENLDENRVRCPDCGATFHRWQHQRALTARSLSGLLEQHGFEPVSVQGLHWGLGRLDKARMRVLHPRREPPRPHLLYVGRRPSSNGRPKGSG